MFWDFKEKNIANWLLKYYGLDNKVLSLTFSEFGRRVAENGSEGTDHGAAAPVMLFGPALKGNGIIGDHPSLSDLNKRGNLKHKLDFRSIYTTILTDWLCGDKNFINKAMLGNEYSLLYVWDGQKTVCLLLNNYCNNNFD